MNLKSKIASKYLLLCFLKTVFAKDKNCFGPPSLRAVPSVEFHVTHVPRDNADYLGRDLEVGGSPPTRLQNVK